MRTVDPRAQIVLLCVVVFFEFLAMGMPLAVLPVHVHDGLGFGSFIVGVVIGSQSIATLATRHLAGTRTDSRGPRRAVVLGLVVSSLAGVALALSATFTGPGASLAVLLVGRALLGGGESLVITGTLAWGFALAGRERGGLVMAWIGMAMYGALAVGSPLGSALEARWGLVPMALAATTAPLFGLVATRVVRGVETTTAGARMPFVAALRLIWRPGAALALAALSFGAIASFSALLFAERGWPHAPLAMTAFGAAYVVARLAFGGVPDRFGGARVAVVSSALAGVGQAGVVFAGSATTAVVAAGLSGLGFSLAFPSFGVEAMKRVPPQNRGAVVGAYTAFFDAAMGFGVPLHGAAVALGGAQMAFSVGALASIAALTIAVSLARHAAR